MSADAESPDPVSEELAQAKGMTRRFWMLQWLRIPDLGEATDGWAGLPRSGRWVMVAMIIGLIMLVPVVGIAVRLLD